jgi:MFS family permease
LCEVPKLPHGLTALRERNYVLYVAGQFISQLGSWVEQTAVAWILYEMTNSPLLLGLSGLFRAVPMIALALFGGAIADRVPRRLLLLLTESSMLIASLTVGLLALTGQLQFWHLYVLSFVSGTLSAFSIPARHALFAGLVPRGSLQSAVTLNAVAVRAGALIGPSIGGVALAYGGHAFPFFINVAGFLGMLLALAAMRLPSHQPDTASSPQSLWHGMTSGLDFVWRNPLLKVALGLEIVSGLFGHNVALITIIARDAIGTGPEGLGLLLSALGAGGLLGMVFMVAFEVKRHVHLILTVGALYAVLLAAFALSPWLGLSMVLLFALGAADGIWAVTRNTLAQLLVPDALRGRVMSVVVMATRGSAPLGRVQGGFVAGLVGGPVAVLVGAAVIGAAVFRSWRLHLPRAIDAVDSGSRRADA